MDSPENSPEDHELGPRLAPVSPTPQAHVDELLRAAGITAEDVVYDLGCGDGRVVITAALKYGARGVGVERDLRSVQQAKANVETSGVGHLVTIIHGNLLEVDLSSATVAILFLLPKGHRAVQSKLLAEMTHARARLVTYIFSMGDVWAPCRVFPISTSAALDTSAFSRAFLYDIPDHRRRLGDAGGVPVPCSSATTGGLLPMASVGTHPLSLREAVSDEKLLDSRFLL